MTNLVDQFSELHELDRPCLLTDIKFRRIEARISAQTGKTMPQLGDFRDRVALSIAAVPEVQAVFTTEYDRMFFVWIVVPDRDYDVYAKVFEKEKSLIDEHTALQFDFTIMPSNGKDPRTLVTDPQARLAYVRI